MPSRFSECKQGWMPQFPSSALCWSLTKMCSQCFTPSLFIAKTRKPLHKGGIVASWREAEITTISLHFPPWWPELFWMAFWLPVTFEQNPFPHRASKRAQTFLLCGERHKHQLVSFLSRNMQCQRMKHQILYSRLGLISVIRKENPPGVWNRNCLNSESEQHSVKELDCLIQPQKFPNASLDISFLDEEESLLKATSSTCFKSSGTQIF